MSLTAHRCLSWMLTLVFAAGVAVGVSRLPAKGGLVGELRWLLQSDEPQALNRAGLLMVLASEGGRTTRASLVEQILASNDSREIDGVLTLLATGVYEPDEATYQAFLHWFDHATTEERVEYLPNSLLCRAGAPLQQGVVFLDWSPEPWDQREAAKDERWIVAATLLRSQPARVLADAVVFGGSVIRVGVSDALPQRLDLVDGVSYVYSEHMQRFGVKPIYDDQLAKQLALPRNHLYEMLNDTIPEVRMGAGRILAVAGVRAALPAFGEWLRHENRQLPPAANKMLTDLYGPDWRQLCESRGATSQSGAGDGR